MDESDQTSESTPDTSGVIQAEYDWSSVDPSTAVIETVAIASDCEPTTLDRLYEIVNPDALNKLIRSSKTGATNSKIVVSFSYGGYDVTVHSTGMVVVQLNAPQEDGE